MYTVEPLYDNSSRMLQFREDPIKYSPGLQNIRIHLPGTDPKEWRKSPWNRAAEFKLGSSIIYIAHNCGDPTFLGDVDAVDWRAIVHKRYTDNVYGAFARILPRPGEDFSVSQVRVVDDHLRRAAKNRKRTGMTSVSLTAHSNRFIKNSRIVHRNTSFVLSSHLS